MVSLCPGVLLSAVSSNFSFSFQSILFLCKGSQFSVALVQAKRFVYLPAAHKAEWQEMLAYGFLQPALRVDHSYRSKLWMTILAVLPLAPWMEYGKGKCFCPLCWKCVLFPHGEGLWPSLLSNNSSFRVGREILRFFSTIFHFSCLYSIFICLFQERSISDWAVLPIHTVHCVRRGLRRRSFICAYFSIWSRRGWDNSDSFKYWLCNLCMNNFLELCFKVSLLMARSWNCMIFEVPSNTNYVKFQIFIAFCGNNMLCMHKIIKQLILRFSFLNL